MCVTRDTYLEYWIEVLVSYSSTTVIPTNEARTPFITTTTQILGYLAFRRAALSVWGDREYWNYINIHTEVSAIHSRCSYAKLVCIVPFMYWLVVPYLLPGNRDILNEKIVDNHCNLLFNLHAFRRKHHHKKSTIISIIPLHVR